MNLYRLSPDAIDDLEQIVDSRTRYSGEDSASKLENQLIFAFERLAEFPGLGRRRSDLTDRPFYFYVVRPYFILYARNTEPLPILAILHSARDVKRILRSRIL